MRNKLNLLVVDDDSSHRHTLLTLLADWGYRVSGAGDGAAALAACQERPFDLLLMDMRMPGMNGIEAMQEIKAYNPAIPVIIMTAYSEVESAVEAIKKGAYDYLTKPLDFEELKLTLERALDHAILRDENRALKNAMEVSGSIIGKSQPMRRMLDMLATIAPSEATVLISGASGTGKELAARMLHMNSQRKKGPYVAINCAALAESLLESELFGHEKGAFTGAERRREGRFFAANQGTIFLDEVGEIPLTMQAKLLRVIQEREIQRVGGDQVIKVDVRIVAATNRDLGEEVQKGNFRQDLYYRLNVVSLHLPALAERGEDIPLLAAHFAQKFAMRNHKTVKGFTPGAMDCLRKYHWPGNVRELENAVERAVVLLIGEYISERELPPGIAASSPASARPRVDYGNMTLNEIEKLVVAETVENAGGNKSEAARRLGITRKTLLSKLQE
jgi:two-component system response regulator HydG